MPLKHNTSDVNGAYVGTSMAQKIYCGTTLLWSSVTLTNASALFSAATGTVRAGYRLNTSGVAEIREGAGYVTHETWLLFGSASDYECRATVTGGAVTSGTTGTWLSLSSSNEWLVELASVGTSSATLTVEIRNAATLGVIASATIQIDVERV